jgi:competence protein ComFC
MRCREKSYPFKRAAAVFEFFGPAASLIEKLKRDHRPYLAKDLAAFMSVQFFRLGWPLPDLLVPVPQTALHTLKRGYNSSELLARELGTLLECPYENLIKRKGGAFPQTGQKRIQRERLSSEFFSWKKRSAIADKTILLIDDTMGTGTTLSHVSALLQEGCPQAIYALVVGVL